MSGIITRKPLIGFASGAIIGSLGLMLVQMDPAPGATSVVVRWMFEITGWFMLFVGAGSLVTALYGILKARSSKLHTEEKERPS